MTRERGPGSTSALLACALLAIVADAGAADLAFDASTFTKLLGKPAIGELNGDGWPEPAGLLSDRLGVLTQPTLPAMGLESIERTGETFRKQGDARVADFNGDGLPDILSITYSCFNDAPTVNTALLFLNQGNGTFSEDTSFTAFSRAHNLRGHGETLVVADFDNNGSLDAYLPYYPMEGAVGWSGLNDAAVICPDSVIPWRSPQLPAPSSHLLRNLGPRADGSPQFEDVTATACRPGSGPGESACPDLLDLQARSYNLGNLIKPEGVQALDFNDDGLLDFYVAGRLFINRGGMKFTNRAQSLYGLPEASSPVNPMDEGATFLDWNNDGFLDLVRLENFSYYPTAFAASPALAGSHYGGPILYQFNGTTFGPARWTTGPGYGGTRTFPGASCYCQVYGVYAVDLDGDGYEDVLTPGSAEDLCAGSPCAVTNQVFLNEQRTSGRFRTASVPTAEGLGSGQFAAGDLDRDGKIDLVFFAGGQMIRLRNTSTLPTTNRRLTIEVLGPNGERNQHGRVLRVRPLSQPATFKFTRIVDGGTSWSQGQYPVSVGTPYEGEHSVDIVFPPVSGTTPVTVSFRMMPGKVAQVFQPSAAYRGGRVVIGDPAPSAGQVLTSTLPTILRALDEP